MKKTFISLSLLLVSSLAFGQKKTEETATTGLKNEFLTTPKFSTNRVLMQNSVAVTGFGAYHEIAGSESYDSNVHLLLKETGEGVARMRMIGSASTPANNRFWDMSGDIYGPTIGNDYLTFQYGGGYAPSFSITPQAKASIGMYPSTYNLQIYEPAAGTPVNLKLSNGTIGNLATDGLDIGINSFGNAYINNLEGNSIGISSGGGGITVNQTNVGIGNPFVSSSSGRLEVYHNTNNTATTPTVNLRTLNNASNGMIRMESVNGVRYFGQYFNLSSGTPANNSVSFDYNGTTPILDLQGNGNVKVSGFTTLGDDATAPKIKMKKLSGTFSANANTLGTATNILHGVSNPAKIISINVLGQYLGSGGYVSNSFLTTNGYQFDYQLDGTLIIITPKQGNSASLVGQNIKIVISYEE